MEKWEAETGEVMSALENKPHIPSHLQFYWNAYAQLRTDRQVGLDKGPIMFSSVASYADRYRLAGDLFDEFVTLIRAMDREELTFKPPTIESRHDV